SRRSGKAPPQSPRQTGRKSRTDRAIPRTRISALSRPHRTRLHDDRSEVVSRRAGLSPRVALATPSANYKWSVVAMLWWIPFFNYADRQAIFSVLPLLEKEMHLTLTQLGLLGSSFAWVYGLVSPFSGNIVDRVRRKTAILGGLHLWSTI